MQCVLGTAVVLPPDGVPCHIGFLQPPRSITFINVAFIQWNSVEEQVLVRVKYSTVMISYRTVAVHSTRLSCHLVSRRLAVRERRSADACDRVRLYSGD